MYNIVLVGAGSIGADKPDELDSPETEFPLTHAHDLYNLHREKKINWLGIVDINPGRLLMATLKWNCHGFNSIDEIKENVDIFVVAVPTNLHAEIIAKIIDFEYKPKIIIVEKPFCRDVPQASIISDGAKSKGIKIIVNYTRRFIKEYKQIETFLKLTNVYHAKLTYGRGMIREACHAIDLFNWWFGDLLYGKILDDFGIPDYSKGDMTYPAFLSYRCCPSIFLCPVDSRKYCIFEIDILTEKGRMLLSESGSVCTQWETEKEGIYGNYNVLTKAFTQTHLELRNALTNLYESVLNGEEICTEKEAIEVHKVYEKILK